MDVLAVNNSIPELPSPIQHAVSKHPDLLKEWCLSRDEKVLELHSYGHTDNNWKFPSNSNSGLCGIIVANNLGYNNILVAGVPLSGKYRYKNIASIQKQLGEAYDKCIVPEYYWWK